MPQTVGELLFTLGAELAVVNFFTIGAGAVLVTVALNIALAIPLSVADEKLCRPVSRPVSRGADQ